MNPEGLTKRLRRPIRQMFWGMGALLRRARGTRWERRVTQALNQLRAGYDNASFDMTRNGELWLLRRLAQLHPLVLLDIGANRGDWSLAAVASCSSATVHAFEPVPATYERLADAARVNGNIRTYPSLWATRLANCGYGCRPRRRVMRWRRPIRSRLPECISMLKGGGLMCLYGEARICWRNSISRR